MKILNKEELYNNKYITCSQVLKAKNYQYTEIFSIYNKYDLINQYIRIKLDQFYFTYKDDVNKLDQLYNIWRYLLILLPIQIDNKPVYLANLYLNNQKQIVMIDNNYIIYTNLLHTRTISKQILKDYEIILDNIIKSNFFLKKI